MFAPEQVNRLQVEAKRKFHITNIVNFTVKNKFLTNFNYVKFSYIIFFIIL